MDVFLIRHAHAASAATGEDDASRSISDRGRSRTQAVSKGLARLGIEFDLLWHSPLLRAVETAELLADRVRGLSRVTPLLAEAPGEDILMLLSEERVALVGHEPWMGELLSLMLGFRLRKPSVAWLAGQPAFGAFRLQALWDGPLMNRLRKA